MQIDRERRAVDAIAREHAAMMELVDVLLETAAGGFDAGAATEALLGLQIYAYGHFETEEMLMRRSAYPEISTHTREHHVLRSALEDLARLIDERCEETALARRLASLAESVGVHVATRDKALEAYCAKRYLSRTESDRGA